METKKCVCNLCGAEAHSVPDSQHRRCSGITGKSEPVEKYQCIPPPQRGKWTAK